VTPLWFWDWKPSAEVTLLWWGVQLQRDEIEEVLYSQAQADDWIRWVREAVVSYAQR
jgi:hypothetical protein